METARGRMTWLEAGAGWPVVLLHAFPLSADMWRPQLERVPEGWRFIAPDLRGFGRSLPPEGGSDMTMDDYAADVLCLMDGLEIEDAVIGGLSMGGYVTFAMFRQAPSRFTGMILADTRSQADTPQAREGRVQLRELLAKDGPRGVADQMLPKLLSEAARREGRPSAGDARAMIESAAARGDRRGDRRADGAARLDPRPGGHLLRDARRRRRAGRDHAGGRGGSDAARHSAVDPVRDSGRRPPVQPRAARGVLAGARRFPARAHL